MTIARVRSATSSITNKVLEIGIKIMNKLQELRLRKEVQERVLLNDGDVLMSLQQVRSHLYKEWDWYYDNDRLVQAFDVQKDMKIVDKWIELEKSTLQTN